MGAVLAVTRRQTGCRQQRCPGARHRLCDHVSRVVQPDVTVILWSSTLSCKLPWQACWSANSCRQVALWYISADKLCITVPQLVSRHCEFTKDYDHGARGPKSAGLSAADRLLTL